MNRINRLNRFLAGLVAVAFFTTSTLTPAPLAHAQSVELPSFVSSFKIPEAFGKVNEILPAMPAAPVLIHIQEAHANYDAQKNIRNILQHLNQNYGVKLILMEGAGYKLTPEIFNFFPEDVTLQQKANEKLMQAGELTGAEVFLIDQRPQTTDKKQKAGSGLLSGGAAAEAYGVENAKAYRDGREAYRQVYQGRKTTESFLADFYLQWQKSADRSLGKSLREFLAREIDSEEGRVPLPEWMVFLKTVAARDLKIDLEEGSEQKDWPVLVRYFRLKKIDPKSDLAKVEKEKATFLSALATNASRVPEALLKEVAAVFENAKKSDLPIYQTRFVFERMMDALPADFSFEAYPALRLYIQQLILLSEIPSETLHQEINALSQKITAALVKTEEERKMVGLLQDYRLSKKLFELELNREEYQQIKARELSPEKLCEGLRTSDQRQETHSTGLKPQVSRLESLFTAALNFYGIAITREDFMMKNALRRMRETNQTKAVLITGGFHTEGFKQKIMDSGSSYISVTPAIGEITPDSQKNYLTAFLGADAVSKSQQAQLVRSDGHFLLDVSGLRELSREGARISEIVGSAGKQAVHRNFVRFATGLAVHFGSRFASEFVPELSPEAARALLQKLGIDIKDGQIEGGQQQLCPWNDALVLVKVQLFRGVHRQEISALYDRSEAGHEKLIYSEENHMIRYGAGPEFKVETKKLVFRTYNDENRTLPPTDRPIQDKRLEAVFGANEATASERNAAMSRSEMRREMVFKDYAVKPEEATTLQALVARNFVRGGKEELSSVDLKTVLIARVEFYTDAGVPQDFRTKYQLPTGKRFDITVDGKAVPLKVLDARVKEFFGTDINSTLFQSVAWEVEGSTPAEIAQPAAPVHSEPVRKKLFGGPSSAPARNGKPKPIFKVPAGIRTQLKPSSVSQGPAARSEARALNLTAAFEALQKAAFDLASQKQSVEIRILIDGLETNFRAKFRTWPEWEEIRRTVFAAMEQLGEGFVFTVGAVPSGSGKQRLKIEAAKGVAEANTSREAERTILSQLVSVMSRRDPLPEKADMAMVFAFSGVAEAARLYLNGVVPRILVSGRFHWGVQDYPGKGYGVYRGLKVFPEAQRYKEILIKYGVPAEAILVEDQSRDMAGKTAQSLALLRAKNLIPRTAIVLHAALPTLRAAEEVQNTFKPFGTRVYAYASEIPEVPTEEKELTDFRGMALRQIQKIENETPGIPEFNLIKRLQAQLLSVSGARSEMRSQEERYEDARAQLTTYGQEHVLQFWEELEAAQRDELLSDIEKIDLEGLYGKDGLYQTLVAHKKETKTDFTGWRPEEPITERRLEALAAGKKLLESGNDSDQAEFGIILLAGGSGSGMGMTKESPKGMFRGGIPFSDETLYETWVKKDLALARAYGHQKMYPMTVMTSDMTDEATGRYYEGHQRFGQGDRMFFKKQRVIPVVTENDDPDWGPEHKFVKAGSLVLESKYKISRQGAGHADAFDYVLQQADVLTFFQKFGVKEVLYLNIDNPLYPFDVHWFGEHVLSGNKPRPAGFVHMSEGLISKEQLMAHLDPKEARREARLSDLNRDAQGIRRPTHYTESPKEIREATEWGMPSFRIISLDSLRGSLGAPFSVTAPSKPGKPGKTTTDYLGRKIPIRKFEAQSDYEPSEGISFAMDGRKTFASMKALTGEAETPPTSKQHQSEYWKAILEEAGFHVEEGLALALPWLAASIEPAKLKERLLAIGFPKHLTREYKGELVQGYWVKDPWDANWNNDNWSWEAVPAARSEGRKGNFEESRGQRSTGSRLSEAELDFLREPDEKDGFIAARARDDERIRRQVVQIEKGLGHDEESARKKAQEAIDYLNANPGIFSGEEGHILDGVGGNAKVIGRVDRSIAIKFGYAHESVNIVLLTPDGKVLLQLRNKKSTSYDDHLSMYGGYLLVGQSHKEGAEKQMREEAGLSLGAGEVVGFEYYDRFEDRRKQRRTWYVKKMTTEEYKVFLEKTAQDEQKLGIPKTSVTRAEYKRALQKFWPQGEGEIVGAYAFPFEALETASRDKNSASPFKDKNDRYFEVTDTFKDGPVTVKAFFTPDSLDGLFSPSNVKLWAAIKKKAGPFRAAAREGEPDARKIETWNEAFEAIRWVSKQEDVGQHIELIREISLRLRERKKTLTLNRSRDYEQYPEDIAHEAFSAAMELLNRTKGQYRRPVKELLLALPYFFSESNTDLHYILWSFAADLDERLLRTKFARDLRQILHGPSFSYDTLALVRAYRDYLDTGKDAALRERRILLESGDIALRDELAAMNPQERGRNEVYQALKELEKALAILFEGAHQEDVVAEWMKQGVVKNNPTLVVAMQNIFDAPAEDAFLRTKKIITARRLILDLEEKEENFVQLYHLYHLDKSLGQMMSISLSQFFDQWDHDGDKSLREALELMPRLMAELFSSGFITRYTEQWADLLRDPELTFDQLKDVLNVIEREIRRELKKWTDGYEAAGTVLFGGDTTTRENVIAMIRKEKFATRAAVKLLEKVKETLGKKRAKDARAFLNPVEAQRLAAAKEEHPFSEIAHVDDFQDPRYDFRKRERKIYGGKGSYLMRMNALGIPVPSAFVIPAYVGKYNWQEKYKPLFQEVLKANMARLEADWSAKRGTPVRYGQVPSELLGQHFEPMFLSVRSGAVFVMPGIFETAVSVGFSPEILEYEIARRGARPALSAYLTFIESMGVSLDVPREEFEKILQVAMKDKQLRYWGDLSEEDLRKIEKAMIDLLRSYKVLDEYEALYRDPEKQLEVLIGKVAESWDATRAKRYRREKNISDEWYTPVIVQAYVFGDRDENSGAGIALSHERQGGGKVFGGEWLPFAHGMTMMQGRLEPELLDDLKQKIPAGYATLEADTMKLAEYFGVPQMIEFTIESGKAWILQTVHDQRVGHDESFPDVDWEKAGEPQKIGEGNVAFGESGALRGFVVFDKEDATRADVIERVKNDPELDAVIFASHFPSTEDSSEVISAHKVLRAVGKRLVLLTAKGGLTSHAAVVANYEEIPTLVSVQGLVIDKAQGVTMGGQHLEEEDTITVDFSSGSIYLGSLPHRPPGKTSRSEARKKSEPTTRASGAVKSQSGRAQALASALKEKALIEKIAVDVRDNIRGDVDFILDAVENRRSLLNFEVPRSGQDRLQYRYIGEQIDATLRAAGFDEEAAESFYNGNHKKICAALEATRSKDRGDRPASEVELSPFEMFLAQMNRGVQRSEARSGAEYLEFYQDRYGKAMGLDNRTKGYDASLEVVGGEDAALAIVNDAALGEKEQEIAAKMMAYGKGSSFRGWQEMTSKQKIAMLRGWNVVGVYILEKQIRAAAYFGWFTFGTLATLLFWWPVVEGLYHAYSKLLAYPLVTRLFGLALSAALTAGILALNNYSNTRAVAKKLAAKEAAAAVSKEQTSQASARSEARLTPETAWKVLRSMASSNTALQINGYVTVSDLRQGIAELGESLGLPKEIADAELEGALKALSDPASGGQASFGYFHAVKGGTREARYLFTTAGRAKFVTTDRDVKQQALPMVGDKKVNVLPAVIQSIAVEPLPKEKALPATVNKALMAAAKSGPESLVTETLKDTKLTQALIKTQIWGSKDALRSTLTNVAFGQPNDETIKSARELVSVIASRNPDSAAAKVVANVLMDRRIDAPKFMEIADELLRRTDPDLAENLEGLLKGSRQVQFQSFQWLFDRMLKEAEDAARDQDHITQHLLGARIILKQINRIVSDMNRKEWTALRLHIFIRFAERLSAEARVDDKPLMALFLALYPDTARDFLLSVDTNFAALSETLAVPETESLLSQYGGFDQFAQAIETLLSFACYAWSDWYFDYLKSRYAHAPVQVKASYLAAMRYGITTGGKQEEAGAAAVRKLEIDPERLRFVLEKAVALASEQGPAVQRRVKMVLGGFGEAFMEYLKQDENYPKYTNAHRGLLVEVLLDLATGGLVQDGRKKVLPFMLDEVTRADNEAIQEKILFADYFTDELLATLTPEQAASLRKSIISGYPRFSKNDVLGKKVVSIMTFFGPAAVDDCFEFFRQRVNLDYDLAIDILKLGGLVASRYEAKDPKDAVKLRKMTATIVRHTLGATEDKAAAIKDLYDLQETISQLYRDQEGLDKQEKDLLPTQHKVNQTVKKLTEEKRELKQNVKEYEERRQVLAAGYKAGLQLVAEMEQYLTFWEFWSQIGRDVRRFLRPRAKASDVSFAKEDLMQQGALFAGGSIKEVAKLRKFLAEPVSKEQPAVEKPVVFKPEELPKPEFSFWQLWKDSKQCRKELATVSAEAARVGSSIAADQKRLAQIKTELEEGIAQQIAIGEDYAAIHERSETIKKTLVWAQGPGMEKAQKKQVDTFRVAKDLYGILSLFLVGPSTDPETVRKSYDVLESMDGEFLTVFFALAADQRFAAAVPYGELKEALAGQIAYQADHGIFHAELAGEVEQLQALAAQGILIPGSNEDPVFQALTSNLETRLYQPDPSEVMAQLALDLDKARGKFEKTTNAALDHFLKVNEVGETLDETMHEFISAKFSGHDELIGKLFWLYWVIQQDYGPRAAVEAIFMRFADPSGHYYRTSEGKLAEKPRTRLEVAECAYQPYFRATGEIKATVYELRKKMLKTEEGYGWTSDTNDAVVHYLAEVFQNAATPSGMKPVVGEFLRAKIFVPWVQMWKREMNLDKKGPRKPSVGVWAVLGAMKIYFADAPQVTLANLEETLGVYVPQQLAVLSYLFAKRINEIAANLNQQESDLSLQLLEKMEPLFGEDITVVETEGEEVLVLVAIHEAIKKLQKQLGRYKEPEARGLLGGKLDLSLPGPAVSAMLGLGEAAVRGLLGSEQQADGSARSEMREQNLQDRWVKVPKAPAVLSRLSVGEAKKVLLSVLGEKNMARVQTLGYTPEPLVTIQDGKVLVRVDFKWREADAFYVRADGLLGLTVKEGTSLSESLPEVTAKQVGVRTGKENEKTAILLESFTEMLEKFFPDGKINGYNLVSRSGDFREVPEGASTDQVTRVIRKVAGLQEESFEGINPSFQDTAKPWEMGSLADKGKRELITIIDPKADDLEAMVRTAQSLLTEEGLIVVSLLPEETEKLLSKGRSTAWSLPGRTSQGETFSLNVQDGVYEKMKQTLASFREVRLLGKDPQWPRTSEEGFFLWVYSPQGVDILEPLTPGAPSVQWDDVPRVARQRSEIREVLFLAVAMLSVAGVSVLTNRFVVMPLRYRFERLPEYILYRDAISKLDPKKGQDRQVLLALRHILSSSQLSAPEIREKHYRERYAAWAKALKKATDAESIKRVLESLMLRDIRKRDPKGTVYFTLEDLKYAPLIGQIRRILEVGDRELGLWVRLDEKIRGWVMKMQSHGVHFEASDEAPLDLPAPENDKGPKVIVAGNEMLMRFVREKLPEAKVAGFESHQRADFWKKMKPFPEPDEEKEPIMSATAKPKTLQEALVVADPNAMGTLDEWKSWAEEKLRALDAGQGKTPLIVVTSNPQSPVVQMLAQKELIAWIIVKPRTITVNPKGHTTYRFPEEEAQKLKAFLGKQGLTRSEARNPQAEAFIDQAIQELETALQSPLVSQSYKLSIAGEYHERLVSLKMNVNSALRQLKELRDNGPTAEALEAFLTYMKEYVLSRWIMHPSQNLNDFATSVPAAYAYLEKALTALKTGGTVPAADVTGEALSQRAQELVEEVLDNPATKIDPKKMRVDLAAAPSRSEARQEETLQRGDILAFGNGEFHFMADSLSEGGASGLLLSQNNGNVTVDGEKLGLEGKPLDLVPGTSVMVGRGENAEPVRITLKEANAQRMVLEIERPEWMKLTLQNFKAPRLKTPESLGPELPVELTKLEKPKTSLTEPATPAQLLALALKWRKLGLVSSDLSSDLNGLIAKAKTTQRSPFEKRRLSFAMDQVRSDLDTFCGPTLGITDVLVRERLPNVIKVLEGVARRMEAQEVMASIHQSARARKQKEWSHLLLLAVKASSLTDLFNPKEQRVFKALKETAIQATQHFRASVVSKEARNEAYSNFWFDLDRVPVPERETELIQLFETMAYDVFIDNLRNPNLTEEGSTYENYEHLTYRHYLERYIQPKATLTFKSTSKLIVGYAYKEADGPQYLVLFDRGGFGYVSSLEEGEPKGWATVTGGPLWETMLGTAGTVQVFGAQTGAGFKTYALADLIRNGLRVGISQKTGFQVLKFVRLDGRQRIELGRTGHPFVNALIGLIKGKPFLGDQALADYLERECTKALHDPQALEALLQQVTFLSAATARDEFGSGLRAVMAFASFLAPNLLEDMKSWDADYYEQLKSIIEREDYKDLFQKGEIHIHQTDPHTGFAISRNWGGKNLTGAIHFSGFPYDHEDGKVWFRIMDPGAAGIKDSASAWYIVRERLRKLMFGLRTGASFFHSSELPGWHIGVKRADRAQILEVVPFSEELKERVTAALTARGLSLPFEIKDFTAKVMVLSGESNAEEVETALKEVLASLKTDFPELNGRTTVMNQKDHGNQPLELKGSQIVELDVFRSETRKTPEEVSGALVVAVALAGIPAAGDILTQFLRSRATVAEKLAERLSRQQLKDLILLYATPELWRGAQDSYQPTMNALEDVFLENSIPVFFRHDASLWLWQVGGVATIRKALALLEKNTARSEARPEDNVVSAPVPASVATTTELLLLSDEELMKRLSAVPKTEMNDRVRERLENILQFYQEHDRLMPDQRKFVASVIASLPSENAEPAKTEVAAPATLESVYAASIVVARKVNGVMEEYPRDTEVPISTLNNGKPVSISSRFLDENKDKVLGVLQDLLEKATGKTKVPEKGLSFWKLFAYTGARPSLQPREEAALAWGQLLGLWEVDGENSNVVPVKHAEPVAAVVPAEAAIIQPAEKLGPAAISKPAGKLEPAAGEGAEQLVWGQNVTIETIQKMTKEGSFGTREPWMGNDVATQKIAEGNRFIVKLIQDTVTQRLPDMSAAARELVSLRPLGVLSTSAFYDPQALGMTEDERYDRIKKAEEALEPKDLKVLELLMTTGWEIQTAVASAVLEAFGRESVAADIVFNHTSWLTSYIDHLRNFSAFYELSETNQDLIRRTIDSGEAAKAAVYALEGITGPVLHRVQTAQEIAQTLGWSRSEARERFPHNWILEKVRIGAPSEFYTFNQAQRGGSERAVRSVSEKIMDGIYPLLANTLNVIEKLLPSVARRDWVQTVHVEAALRMFGITKVQDSEGFILDAALAIDKGAAAVMGRILNGQPIAVLVREGVQGEADIAFIKEHIQPLLAAQKQKPVLIARTLEEAKAELAAKIQTQGTAPSYKAMVMATGNMAVALKKQLGDGNVVVVTDESYARFLERAGQLLSSLAQNIQAQFALSRSA